MKSFGSIFQNNTTIYTNNVDKRNLTKIKKIKEKQLYILYNLDNGNDYIKRVLMCVCLKLEYCQ